MQPVTIHTDLTQFWIRIFSSGESGLSFLLIGYSAFYLATRRGLGHKRLIWIGAIFASIRGANLIYSAFALHERRFDLTTTYLFAFSGIFCMVFALCLYTARKDLQVTLRISEEEDRARDERLADVKMASTVLSYSADMNLARAKRLQHGPIISRPGG